MTTEQDGESLPSGGRRRPDERRTDWAEDEAAKFCGFPLTAETVFLRVKYEKGGEKEVADVLLALRGEAIVLSLKHQDDPDSRTGERLGRWCEKAARKAAGELVGAVRTIKERRFWCDHRRRGRVEFAPGDLHVQHAIAYVETFEPVVLPADLPGDAHGVTVTYLASNDLLNLIDQLRSFPDLVDYLDARAKLPLEMRRTIGREKDLYAVYLLNDETFDGCRRFADVEAALIPNSDDLERRIAEKLRKDRFAKEIEFVSDCLAVRAPDYAVGLDAATLALFDPPDGRTNYTTIQEHLCDLRLPERRMMGKMLHDLRQQAAENKKGIGCLAFLSDRKNFLYVLAVAKGLSRAEIVKHGDVLLQAGLAHYGKTHGMVLVDRSGLRGRPGTCTWAQRRGDRCGREALRPPENEGRFSATLAGGRGRHGRLGHAQQNPSLDVSGGDPCRKHSMTTHLNVARMTSSAWCYPLLNALQNNPKLVKKHKKWSSHKLSDLAFSIDGRLRALRILVHLIDKDLATLERALEQDPVVEREVADGYAHVFWDMDLLAVHRVLVCMASFIREARSCFENLADFRSEFLVHYSEAHPEDDKARYAALDELLGKPEWIQKLRDLRHEVSHDRYPWLAFERVKGPSTRYEPILM